MPDHYTLCGIFFSALIPLVALYNFVFARKSRIVSSAASPQCMNSITTASGECRSPDSSGEVDVIIVGAGVAGSALAHTLGKVFLIYRPFSFLHDSVCPRTGGNGSLLVIDFTDNGGF